MSGKITAIKARQVLDSRGLPTVEAEVYSSAKSFSRAIVPSGASTGSHEAVELRDNGKEFLGKGTTKAVENIEKVIAAKLKGFDLSKQNEIDELMIELDGTENKSKLGANAILAVSMAAAREAAKAEDKELYEYIGKLSGNKNFLLPVPASNIINGGKHAGNNLDIQEYMLYPNKAKNFSDALRFCSETYQTLKNIIKEKYGKTAVNVGDEGGFAPQLSKPEEPIELILKAVEELGYGNEINLALDCAASEFYSNNSYTIEGKNYSNSELVDFYGNLLSSYKQIVSIEDPFAEDDWEGFTEFTKKFGSKLQIIGDDLLVTNVKRIKKAIEQKACNALLLKLNQIGTVTEAIAAAKLSTDSKWNVMVSHRSGETEDTFIADFVVGLGTAQLKAGAPCRSERNAKYNQLLRIEERLGKNAWKPKI